MTQTGSDASRNPKQPRRTPPALITGAVVITLLAAVLTGLAVQYFGGQSDSGGSAAPLPAASTTPTSPPSTATPTASPSSAPKPFRYQPLWPFASEAEAADWQRDGGQQPWHLDADQTALSFTTGYLGFKEIDQVVSRTIEGDDARISVGYKAEGSPSVAAVIHLVRIGQGTDAPWEVVGTIDSDLTLERPKYAATATSPITAGGKITGVDESLRVDVRQPSSEKPIGTYCCLPAGGENQPWTAKVTFKGATDPALTVVVSTGGHVQDIERFAITGLRINR
jgi:hypothetical protein